MGRAERARSGGSANVVADKPAAKQFTEAELEQIGTDTKRMDHRERIAYWDKRQANHETQTLCPNDAKHGALTMTGSGAAMICSARHGGAWCTGNMPVSV